MAVSAPPILRVLNTGTAANDRTGDKLRDAFWKTNENFVNSYSRIIAIQATGIALHASETGTRKVITLPPNVTRWMPFKSIIHNGLDYQVNGYITGTTVSIRTSSADGGGIAIFGPTIITGSGFAGSARNGTYEMPLGQGPNFQPVLTDSTIYFQAGATINGASGKFSNTLLLIDLSSPTLT